MALKRIIKFVLQMAFVAAVLVGGYFLIKSWTQKNTDSELIAATTISRNFTSEVNASKDGIWENSTGSLKSRMNALNKINSVLLRYYDYYVKLSLFENEKSASTRNQVLSKFNEMMEMVADTKEYVKLFATSNSEVLPQRVRLAAGAYVEQTKTFFELVELLKNHVYTANYGLQSTGVVYEAQLEMMKDYCKTAFTQGIYGKLDNVNSSDILTVDEETSFVRTLNKFNTKYSSDNIKNVNSTVEIMFSKFYMSLEKDKLNTYYNYISKNDKSNYVSAIEDQTQRLGFGYLQQYLLQAGF